MFSSISNIYVIERYSLCETACCGSTDIFSSVVNVFHDETIALMYIDNQTEDLLEEFGDNKFYYTLTTFEFNSDGFPVKSTERWFMNFAEFTEVPDLNLLTVI